MKCKAIKKDGVDTSHFMERNLRLNVNKTFCLTFLKAGLVSKSSCGFNPTEQGMPEDGLVVTRTEPGKVFKTDSYVSTESNRLCLSND